MTQIVASGVSSLAFYATPATGTDLPANQVVDVNAKVRAASNLAQAIRNAMASAQSSHSTSFQPNSAFLTLPAGLSSQTRDELFNDVLEHAYAGSALTLQRWSLAVDKLEAYAARQASSLPPSQGGGAKYYGGVWYLNGEPISFAMLFVASRVNTYDALDNLMASSLNTISANNRLVHRLGEMLKAGRALSGDGMYTFAAREGYYQPGHVWDDAYPRQDALHWSVLQSLASSIIGPTSKIVLGLQGQFSFAYTGEDWKTAMDELSTIMDSKTADNQIAQLRMESVMNSRANLLDGMSSFMKGQQNAGSSVSRNI